MRCPRPHSRPSTTPKARPSHPATRPQINTDWVTFHEKAHLPGIAEPRLNDKKNNEENFPHRRRYLWPEHPPPMILSTTIHGRDSGSGTFTGERLAVVLCGAWPYEFFNKKGEPVSDDLFRLPWELPV